MTDKTSKSERTRQFIIEKTAPVFNTKGYIGTSMTDLTEVTGLTKGSIYGNFKNKNEVALAAFHHNMNVREKIIRSWVSAAKTSTEKLLAYVAVFHSKNNRVFPEGGCPLLNTGTEADDTNETFRRLVSEKLLHWKKDIEDILKKGITTREFKKSVAIQQTAISILALIEGGIFMAQSTKDPAMLDAALETAKSIIDTLPAKQKEN